MGYERGRFRGDVEDDLICPICQQVLEEPLQVPRCEHAFCKACIQEWLSRHSTCPVDRNPITSDQLQQASRILRNYLSRLEIACENASYGCTTFVKLDMMSAHKRECRHNPAPVPCPNSCGIALPSNELKDHNCVRDLRKIFEQQAAEMQREISDQASMMAEMHTVIADQASRIKEMQTEILDVWFLKECMKSIVEANPEMRQIQTILENAAGFPRWFRSLQSARVTRWNTLISGYNAPLYESIRNALIDNGCPLHMTSKLMENSYERQWPSGLSSLEARERNRGQFRNYVAKRIPGKQAVVVMKFENNHMPEELIVDPGLVMIFNDGVG